VNLSSIFCSALLAVATVSADTDRSKLSRGPGADPKTIGAHEARQHVILGVPG